MRMKRFGVVMALCATMLLTACDAEQEEEKPGSEATEQDRKEDEPLGTNGDGGTPELRQEKLELEKDSLDYIAETDGQPFFRWTSMTKSEYGYYFWEGGNGRMLFRDTASGQTVPLCNRPDCDHDKEDCNAWFNTRVESGTHYVKSFLQFYEGNLYVIGRDEEDYVNLYRVAEDGSSCEKYMELYKADLSADSVEGSEGGTVTEFASPYVCIHRGYVYFIDHKESTPKLRRMKLGGDEVEIVYETTGVRPNLYRMEAYGNYVFFQAGNFTDDTCLDMDGGIFAYNIETGEVQLVKKDAISTYILRGSDIYYSVAGAIWRYSLTDQEDVQVVEYGEQYYDMYADEYYIYILDRDTDNVLTYDYDGSAIATISYEDFYSFYGGDGEYIFCEGTVDGNGTLAALKTTDIGEGHIVWEPLY